MSLRLTPIHRALLGAFFAFGAHAAQAAYTDLIISEYIEGSSNNKAIELYNGTSAPIDLAAGGYKVRMYFNGGTSPTLTHNLSGVIPAGGVFVLANPSASSAILSLANETTSSNAWYNGDDAVLLVKGAGNTVVDSVGQVGNDPGAEWGTGLTSTADNTLRRKTAVSAGDTNVSDGFDPASQWDGFAIDSFSDLGVYSGGTSGDAAPAVASSVPADGSGNVLTSANLAVSFTEPVVLASGAFTLQCSVSGAKAVTVSGSGASYTLDPASDFTAGESCTLTVNASQVTDVDTNDGPDAMLANYVAVFTVAAPVSACAQPFTATYAIQGSGAASPLSGTVTTQGVVVGDYEGAAPALRGFYIQDANGDGDPYTSDGLFVFDGSNGNKVQPGQVVRVTGTVSEFQNQTQVSATSVQVCGTGSVAPTDVYLPAANASDLERFEGMLVRLPQTLHVTEHFQLGRFGQVVVSVNDRQAQPTNVVAPGAPAAALQAQNLLSRIILDDGENGQNPDPIVFGRGGLPLSASNTLRGGDTVSNVTGVMTYTWAGNAASGNAWRVRPVNALGASLPDFQPANPRPSAAPARSGSLRAAGFNVLNYFNTFGTTACRFGVGGGVAECRGAEDSGEFQRQVSKTVAALVDMNADVVALGEIENDGYGSGSAIRHLVDAVNAQLGAGTYAVLDVDARTGQLNAAGTDAIKVGFIYKPGSVTPVGTTAALNSVAFVNGGDGAPRNRPAIAQAFQQADGERFIAVANHLKSKGSECDAPDAGDGQGNCNAVRLNAANLMRTWLASNPTGTGDADVLILGDLNSYAKEDPIRAFTSNGWVNLIEAWNGPEAYSYVFDGQWGYLDHALASPSLAAQVSGTADWHVNADEPNVLDYNTNFKSAGQIASLYAPDEFRNSDHDPVIVDLRLVSPGTCTNPDLSPVVTLGAVSSGVSNRVIAKGCTIDDLIGDEGSWASRAAFLSHVSQVSFDLLKQNKITAAERNKLMAAAQQSGIGN